MFCEEVVILNHCLGNSYKFLTFPFLATAIKKYSMGIFGDPSSGDFKYQYSLPIQTHEFYFSLEHLK